MDIVGYEQRVQELDHRQDDVLERLEELDRRLVSLIEIWSPRRDTKAADSPGPHSPDSQSRESRWHEPVAASDVDAIDDAASTPNRRSAA